MDQSAFVYLRALPFSRLSRPRMVWTFRVLVRISGGDSVDCLGQCIVRRAICPLFNFRLKLLFHCVLVSVTPSRKIPPVCPTTVIPHALL